MREIEAISGVFLNNEKDRALFLRRSQHRTYSANQWDLMGGDIESGETPQVTLARDALQKLNITSIKVMETIDVNTQETDAIITRHVFVCIGDYSSLKIDTKKYYQHGWFTAKGITSMNLTNHAYIVLQTIGFTN